MRIKRNDNQVNMQTDTQNNNMYNGFQNNQMNSNNMPNNMNNNFNNANNMNNNYNNNPNNMNNNYNNNPNNNVNNMVASQGYQEKTYKTGTLEENTVVTTTSKISRLFLFGFYLLFIVIGVVAFLMIRADRYEFYLKNDEVTIFTGSTYQIELTPKDVRYFDYLNYNYKIENEQIAVVDDFGTITAIGEGTTTLKISLSPGFTSKTMKIHSESLQIEKIDLMVYEDDKLSAGEVVTLKPDQSISLKAIPNNREDLNVTVTYSSSNTSVATIDEFGNVTAKSEGTAVITGTKDDISGKITINVKKNSSGTTPVKSIQSISFGTKDIPVKKGKTLQLSLLVTPKELSNSSFEWKSSDTNIITVNNNGLVTAINNGNATITATSSNGKTATCNITVTNEDIKPTKITLNSSSASITVGNNYQLIATISPTTATDRNLTWTSSDNGIATVNNGLVTGVKEGTAVITVTSSDGKVKATSTITVKKEATPTGSTGKVTKVSLGITQTTKYVNETLQLSATVTPSSVTKYDVIWSSNNTDVATVTQSGLVTAKKTGTVVITAMVDGVRGYCTIIVKEKSSKPTPTVVPSTAPKPSGGGTVPAGAQFSSSQLKLSTTGLTVGVGKTQTFKVTATKSAGTISVTSSDPSVVKVDLPAGDPDMPICNVDKHICFLDGFSKADEIEFKVTGVKAGTAYINVSIDDIQTTDDQTLSGTGKVGILVK